MLSIHQSNSTPNRQTKPQTIDSARSSDRPMSRASSGSPHLRAPTAEVLASLPSVPTTLLVLRNDRHELPKLPEQYLPAATRRAPPSEIFDLSGLPALPSTAMTTPPDVKLATMGSLHAGAPELRSARGARTTKPSATNAALAGHKKAAAAKPQSPRAQALDAIGQQFATDPLMQRSFHAVVTALSSYSEPALKALLLKADNAREKQVIESIYQQIAKVNKHGQPGATIRS